MFYISSAAPEGRMDASKLVQKKLASGEACLQCVECALVSDKGTKKLRYVALIEKNDEHGIFIYSSDRVPCLQSNDLKLETVLAINSELKCQAEAPQKASNEQQDFVLRLSSKSGRLYVLEMPKHETTQSFLAEIKRAQDLYSQNAAFAELPSLNWLKKYTATISGPSTDEVLDPMKYMNLSETNTHVMVTDIASTSRSQWYENDVATTSSDVMIETADVLHKERRSQSTDSLDFLSDRKEDAMESVQRQMVSSGDELMLGIKPASSREKFVRHFLTEREEEFTNLRKFKVYCGTWNVNGQSPSEPLHKWLVVDNDPPDIYAIGFQELDLSNNAYVFSASPKEAEWQNSVKSYLHPKAKYRKLKSVRLVGVMLIVYIQEKHVSHVNFIDTDSVATGIMGFVGNKGGVSVRFTLYSTSFCFVNSHLAAHQEEFERRNQDYRDIEFRTKFKQFAPPLDISEHDLVFWIGDLNYRINLPIDEVKSCIRKGMLKRLMEFDQLMMQMRSCSDVFKGYEEGVLTFDPTYRFDVGTNNYDSSEKNRIPAFCDRILWRGSDVRQHRYDSHPTLKLSDHKPVSSLFTVGVRVIDKVRYKKVYEDIMKQLDRLENEYLPQIKLDKTELEFKDVRFMEAHVEVVTIANVGQVPLEFEFITKLDDDSYCRPWLSATPHKNTIIKPGGSCEVQVVVYVDKYTAAKMNTGEEKLEDILVLHLNGGKDSFITVKGNYLNSVFGSSIEALVQMHGPIREVPVADLLTIEQPGSLARVDISQDGGRLYMVPKEIWKMVDFIHKNGSSISGIFKTSGLSSEIQQIRECLDVGKPDLIPREVSVHSVAEAFMLFLESLAQPVIPCQLYTACLASSNTLLLSKQLLHKLPDCHKNVFLYVCAFLRELLQHSDYNGLDIKFLANIFGEVMLRPSSMQEKKVSARDKKSLNREKEEKTKRAAFLYHFISNDLDV